MSQRQISKASRLRREREKVARFIVSLGARFNAAHDGSDAGGSPFVEATDLLGGSICFDVHEARAAATRLTKLETEQIAFEDWTRQRGLGPENQEPYAFRECNYADGLSRGGWPGNLARRWASEVPDADSRAPMGRTLAKLGRAVLRALEGLESGCQRCGGCGLSTPIERATGEAKDEKCPTCKGTGHNLRGSPPYIEDWAPVAVAAASDAWTSQRKHSDIAPHPQIDTHSYNVLEGHGTMEPAFATVLTDGTTLERSETRVVARGEHRPTVVAVDASLDARLTARGLRRGWKLPRWRRGELKHAQQRRGEHAFQVASALATRGSTTTATWRAEIPTV